MKLTSLLVSSLFVCGICVEALALSSTDPGVIPVQSISDHRYRDGLTGRFIKNVETTSTTSTNLPATTTQPGTNLPATTAKPGTNLPVTTPKPGTNLPATTTQPGTNLPATTAKPGTNLPATTPKPGTNLPATTTQPGTNLPATTAKPGTNLPATTAKPGTNLPATTTQPGTNLPATTAKPGTNLPATTTGGGTNVPKTTGGGTTAPAARVNGAGAALGVIGMVSGAAGLYESTAGSDKATWGDVLSGAASGATFAAGTAALVNAIPVGGQIAYGAAIAAGAVIGTMGAGAEMFSETDCETDPVLGIYACCNISKLSNIDAYRAEIGDKMFTDTFPYVRYCVQGKQEFKEEQPWLKGRFLDDHWSSNPEVALCPGYSMPANEDMKIQAYAVNDANIGFCWAWECAEPGRVRSGGTCIGSDVESADEMGPVLPGDTNGASGNVGEICDTADLPQYATSGVYVNNGVAVVCAATSCQTGTYLVVNSSGVSQGWCVASTYCKDGTKLNIINGTQTDLQCLSQDTPQAQEENANQNGDNAASGTAATTETESSEQQTVDNRNECERGVAGYVIFEGICMPEYQKVQIEQQRKAKELASLQNSIDKYADRIAEIEDAHSGDKVTVWKNEEGKFNTSRLLSDSLAGVALGTVGGLVVNKVVKNNNIETGFDEIGCAIDGERIANFDDTFVISGAVDKNGCVGNNQGYSNVYVWASRQSNGADYTRMVEDVANPDNNTCWVRVDIESDNAKIQVSDIPARWFMVGQQITCGNWTDRDALRQRALDARKSARTWATVGGAVGGAGVGVGVMELFGNRLIGGKVMGQKALDEAELLYSQMSEEEREEYKNSSEQIEALCSELHAKGGTHAACGD